jgi:hypothetical protein
MPGRNHPIPQHLQAGALPAAPAIETVEQEQAPQGPSTVPVRVVGPISTHPLPARRGAAFTQTVGTPPAFVSLLGRELKRQSATLMSSDKPFLYSTTEASLSQALAATAVVPAGAAYWPANVPLPLHNADQVYVACFSSTASDVATISVIVETYAD